MKKATCCYFIIIILSTLLSSCSPNSLSEIELSNINNAYNNSKVNLTSDLAQIEDKLYYRYRNSFGAYDIYLISNSETKKIDINLSLDSIYNNTLLNTNNRPITYFDEKMGRYLNYENINLPNDFSYYDVCVCCDNIYFDSSNGFYRYNNETLELWVDKSKIEDEISFRNTFICGDFLYYIFQNAEEKTYICRYDSKTDKTEKFNIGDLRIVSSVLANEKCAYFLADSGPLYKVDFTDKSLQKVFDSDLGMLEFNLYKETICVAVQSGTDTAGIFVSENNSEFKKISNKDATALYILDEKYIYFIADNGNLYRVNIDGSKSEKIFGF